MKKMIRKKSRKTLLLERDLVYQQETKKFYKTCALCTNEIEIIHHFIHKSQSEKLRYEFKNGVPLCKKCHFRVHARNNPIDVLNMIEFMEKANVDWLIFIKNNY